MSEASTIIMPLAGKSKRFPGMRLKWTLTAPDGEMMLKKALESIGTAENRVILGILREHEQVYGLTAGLRRAINNREIEVVLLDKETSGPADTVFQVIQRAGVSGPIVVKDSDSWFAPIMATGHNFVAVADLRNSKDIRRIASKSFVVVNDQMMITNVVEKSVASNFISVGGYAFRNAELFLSCFHLARREVAENELFVSHVIVKALERKEAFEAVVANSYIDVGTLTEWLQYRDDQSTYFVDVDGVLVENRGEYFGKLWTEEDRPLSGNVKVLLQLQQRGAQLVFVTARPERLRAKVVELIEKLGLRPHSIVMDCRHAKRILVNDFANTNPFPSAIAINLPRDSDSLDQYL